ncbi:MAG: hypothetical protein ACRDDX_03905 [Cellulosilyticaceae bacterium]
MITAKELKEEILVYDIIKYTDEDGKEIECVEVTLADRIIDVYMDTKEVNVGIIVKKILEQGLYEKNAPAEGDQDAR